MLVKNNQRPTPRSTALKHFEEIFPARKPELLPIINGVEMFENFRLFIACIEAACTPSGKETSLKRLVHFELTHLATVGRSWKHRPANQQCFLIIRNMHRFLRDRSSAESFIALMSMHMFLPRRLSGT